MEEGLEADLERSGRKWKVDAQKKSWYSTHGNDHEGRGKLRAQHTAMGSRHEVTGCGGKFHT